MRFDIHLIRVLSVEVDDADHTLCAESCPYRQLSTTALTVMCRAFEVCLNNGKRCSACMKGTRHAFGK